MNEEQVNMIRESSRNELVLNRRKHRDEQTDIRRSNLRVTPNTVVNVANKLKTKSLISGSELRLLKNGLMDDVRNIEVVLNTHGALRGLVRELSGHDVDKQCAAAGCCCNLALGDCKAGVAVAKAAGAYLIAALDNLTAELATTCAWALGNLAGSGRRAAALLAAQGAGTKLADLLHNTSQETREAALYALEHFTYQLGDDLRTEHLNQILQSLPLVDIPAASRLLFILSCHNHFTHRTMTDEYIILKLIEHLALCINNYSPNNSSQLLNLIRLFANINSEDIYNTVLNQFLGNNLIGNIKLLLSVDGISESLLWLLGNMYSCCSNHAFFGLLR